MRLSNGLHFSYCLNVHPGETLDDVIDALHRHVPRIKTSLSPRTPFGLGLRIARHAATELLPPRGHLDLLANALHEEQTYAFTINGFPFGAFHNTRVKQTVYLPDWSDPGRLAYTRDLFDLLAALLPPDTEGSVSTVPLGYKFAQPPIDPATAHAPLLDLARHLADLEARTGKLLHLGLEPEPDCLLETTPETLAFFQNLFRTAGPDEALVRRHIGVCLDTCHVAMQFEDPAHSLLALANAGIRVSKIQLSAALECDARDIPPDALRAFDDGVYLHQVTSTSGRRWRDLPDFLSAPDRDAGTLRIHAHVPLHWPGDAPLRSTRSTLTPEFWSAIPASGCTHLEVETYTFNVLPQTLRQNRHVADNMIHECQWALDQLPPLETKIPPGAPCPPSLPHAPRSGK